MKRKYYVYIGKHDNCPVLFTIRIPEGHSKLELYEYLCVCESCPEALVTMIEYFRSNASCAKEFIN